jgi:uncharacterized phage protein (TIGR02218 family)
MRNHPDLAAWLPTARQVEIVELLTVTNPAAAVWRYAAGLENVVQGADTWLGSASASGLMWRRSALTFKAGIELGECTLIISARAGDTINALPVATALRARIWDDAAMLLSRAYFDENSTLRGVLPRYQGRLGKMVLRDGDIELTLKPPSQTLNRAVPPVYQAACHNTVFDAACGVDRAAFTVAGAAQAGSSSALVETGRAEAAGFFAGGVITFTAGALTGLARTVRAHAAGGAVSFFVPLPQAPAAGDGYTLTPSCDRSTGAGGCARFYSPEEIIVHFRGTPFIPLPVTAL